MQYPFGEMLPSTIAHEPSALGSLAGVKNLHPEHCMPLLGEV